MDDMMNMDGSGWDESMFDDIAGDEPDLIKKVVFLIDRSGSMDGTTIGTINTVMEELLSELDEHKIRIAAAEIDENIEWQTDAPVSASQFGSWERTRSGSFSNLGKAFAKLAENLKKPDWQEKGKKGAIYYFILFSDGLASDDYKAGLQALLDVPSFYNGKRMVVNFSDIQNPELLGLFTGNKKNVIQASGRGAIDVVENAILNMVNG